MGFGSAPLLIFAFCVVIVLAGSLVLLRTRWLRQWLVGTAGLLLIGLSVYFALYALNLFSYQPLSREQPLATISFRMLAPQTYVATVSQPDSASVDYQLQGDLWQLETRLVRWKGLFSLFGFQPGYQLERIEGRYLSLEDQRNRERSDHRISREAIGIDIWRSARDGWSLMVEPGLATVNYMPMADGAIYEIVLSGQDIVSRPLNGAAQAALGQWE